MKILMLTDSYPPRIDGGGRHVQLLGKQLAKRGHRVIVFTIGYPDLPKYAEENGVKVYRLAGLFQRIPFLFKDPALKWPPPTGDWLITRELRRIVEKEKPDIIHAHGGIVFSVLPLKKSLKIPLVTTLHGYGLICPKKTLVKYDGVCDRPFTSTCITCSQAQYGITKSLAAYLATKFNKDKLGYVDEFIAVSSYVKEAHRRHLGLDDNDIVVIPNFYAGEVSEALRASGRLPQDFILFVGTLIPLKGVNILIEAYQKLCTPTKLVMIGTRHPNYYYKGTGNIAVLENPPRHLVLEAYRNCRFAIFPSVWPEPFGTVVLEAMSYRKAVIACKTGGFTDVVVDRETGILVPPNDSEGLSNAIKYLLENPEVATNMGQKGYERWRQFFTPEVVVPKVEELYKVVRQFARH